MRYVAIILSLMIAIVAISAYVILNNNEKAVLRIGMMPIADNLQLFVALEKGFFEDVGLEVELIPMSGGAVIGPAVASGDLDIGWSNIVSIVRAHEKGFDFMLLTPGAEYDSDVGAETHALLVNVNSNISMPTDLRDKTIAINTFGNINELAILAWAEHNNIDSKKIRLVEVPFSQMEIGLASRGIDAALVSEPFLAISLLNNGTKKIEPNPYDSLSRRMVVATWFSTSRWIENNPDKTMRFVQAISSATEYIQAHPEDVQQILVKHAKLTEEQAGFVNLPKFGSKLSREDIQRTISACKQYGFLDEEFDPQDIIYSRINQTDVAYATINDYFLWT